MSTGAGLAGRSAICLPPGWKAPSIMWRAAQISRANSSRRKSLARRRGTITAHLLLGLRAEGTGTRGLGIVAFPRRALKPSNNAAVELTEMGRQRKSVGSFLTVRSHHALHESRAAAAHGRFARKT